MPIVFEDFKRENVWLRMALLSPTGGGKTEGALRIATNLFGPGALKVGLLDSEHGRAKLAADRYRVPLYARITGDFTPAEYIKGIRQLKEAGAEVILIDSISQEWTRGVLPMADKFGDWKTARPRHTEFIEEILGTQAHIIVTIRSKMKFDVSEEERDGRTRQVIRKMGLGPVQDDAILYEFDVLASIDAASHEATFSNRCRPLVDTTRQLDEDVAKILTAWLSEGEAPELPEAATPEAVDLLVQMLLAEGHAPELVEERFAQIRRENQGVLTAEYITEAAKKAIERGGQVSPEPTPEEAEPAGDPATATSSE